jgi:serine acetyltransferase
MKEGAEICPCAVIAGGGDVTLNEFSTVNFHCTLIPSTFTSEGEFMNDVVVEKTVSVRGSITLGKGAYIGSNAVICVSEKNPHIHIGDRAVIGALSYVDHDVEANTVVHPKIIYDVKKGDLTKNERQGVDNRRCRFYRLPPSSQAGRQRI